MKWTTKKEKPNKGYFIFILARGKRGKKKATHLGCDEEGGKKTLLLECAGSQRREFGRKAEKFL